MWNETTLFMYKIIYKSFWKVKKTWTSSFWHVFNDSVNKNKAFWWGIVGVFHKYEI